MSTSRVLPFVLLLAAVAACRPDDQRTDTMDVQQAIQDQRESLPLEVVAHLDSGSAAFRRDDHQGALDHYTRASELAPDAAAAWFGIYMAQQALGKLKAQALVAGKNRNWNLTTSLKSYVDPRVFHRWGQEVDYDVLGRYYSTTLRRKFSWVRQEDRDGCEVSADA